MEIPACDVMEFHTVKKFYVMSYFQSSHYRYKQKLLVSEYKTFWPPLVGSSQTPIYQWYQMVACW